MTPERKAELRAACEKAITARDHSTSSEDGVIAALDFATDCTDAIPELLDAVDTAEEETRTVRDVLRAVLDCECMVSAGPEFGAICETVTKQLPSDLRAEAEAVVRGKP